MHLSLSRWRPRHLLAAWGAYWLSLIGITLGPALAAALPLILGPDTKGSVSANAGDEGVTLTIMEGARTVWSGATTAGTIAFCVAVPPLILFLLWLAQRPRTTAAAAEPAEPHALPQPAARTMPVPGAEKEPVAEPRQGRR